MDKEIPSGTWLYFTDMAAGITDVALQEFLANCGIDLPLENISVRQYPHCSGAKVTITREATARLVNWAINGQQLNGRNVEAAASTATGKTKDRVGNRDYKRTFKNTGDYKFEEAEES